MQGAFRHHRRRGRAACRRGSLRTCRRWCRPARRTLPRHLRHFRIAPRIAFDEADNGRTTLSLVCTDRPGLLADVAQTLRNQGMRVHDARIATFGERAEDVFQITATTSDGRDRPLDPARQQALSDALLGCLEGDAP